MLGIGGGGEKAGDLVGLSLVFPEDPEAQSEDSTGQGRLPSDRPRNRGPEK